MSLSHGRRLIRWWPARAWRRRAPEESAINRRRRASLDVCKMEGVPRMAHPVVHFEVIGKDPARLRHFYGDLFDWSFDTPSPVAPEVSSPESYGFVDLITSDDGAGIRGGIGGGEEYDSHALFYVGVPDVEAAIRQAELLGGTRVMGPVTSPNGLVVAHFTDPEGNLIGVAGVT